MITYMHWGKNIFTIFIWNLNMEEEKFEARDVRTNDLLQSPIEGSFATYWCMRVTLDRRLVHSDHNPSRLALHSAANPTVGPLIDCAPISTRSLELLLFVCFCFLISLNFLDDPAGLDLVLEGSSCFCIYLTNP